MGIKPKYIKDLGELLVERYPNAFGTDFEHNKDAVDELTTVDSKSVRNRVAGYTTRLKVQEQYTPEMAEAEPADD